MVEKVKSVGRYLGQQTAEVGARERAELPWNERRASDVVTVFGDAGGALGTLAGDDRCAKRPASPCNAACGIGIAAVAAPKAVTSTVELVIMRCTWCELQPPDAAIRDDTHLGRAI